MTSPRFLLATLLLVMAACAPQRLAPRSGFALMLGREHPLTGRVYSRAANALVPVEHLDQALRAAQLVLVGETHDNVDHHQLEAELLARFLEGHGTASAAFEMLDETQAPALTPQVVRPDELADRVGWAESGWPEFAMYRPVFEVALNKHVRIIAAHPSREHVRAAMHETTAEDQARLFLAQPLPEDARVSLANEIRESHCGHAPEGMVEAMVRAQSYKDAFMAHAVLHARPAMLFAGTGHIREDRGVPLFLARAKASHVLTIALIDVDDARTHAQDYEHKLYDFMIFTPRVTDEDACARFAEQLKRMREGKARP